MAKSKQNKDENKNFVLTLPIKMNVCDEHILDKRYEYLRQIYNIAQRRLLNQFMYFAVTKEYKSIKTIKEKKDFFKTHPFKIKGYDKKITFTEFSIKSYLRNFAKLHVSKDKTYKDFGINTKILDGIFNNIWRAWNKRLYDLKVKKIHFKEHDELNNITFYKSNNYFVGLNVDLSNMVIKMNVNGCRMSKAKFITFNLNKKLNDYETFALKGGCDSIKVISIVRKEIRGKKKYYCQFCIEGEKPMKNRILGKGQVGIDLGTSTIAVSSLNGVSMDILAEKCNKIDRETYIIDRKMDRSRRATNPQNYTEDGQIVRNKKGETRKWNYSKHYIKLRSKRKELYRKNAAIRKIEHEMTANKLLSLGNVFVVENNPIKDWQTRAKETTINKKGKYISKKRYGKSIANHAPSEFITILENKVVSLGGRFEKVDIKNSASRFDFTNETFNEHNVGVRKITLSNGNIHQRDMLASFNLQHLVIPNENLKEYDVEQMKLDYPIYCKLEKQEIALYKNGNKKQYKSVIGKW